MVRRDLVSVGLITGAHGVKGEVKLKSFTADPTGIASYNPLETESGKQIEIAKLRPQADGFIAVLKGVTDRNTAESLKGRELFIPRERLAEPKAGEVYLRDLIGLEVWDGDNALGPVVSIANYGAGDLLEVRIVGCKGTVFIPFNSDFVRNTDPSGGKISVDLPEGFLDENE